MGNTNSNKNVSNSKKKSPNATIEYLLKKKNLIYKWIVNGLTMSDIADKLSVSRSWLFEAFKKSDELKALKEEAFSSRREKLSCTLYQMAFGNYKTKVRHTNTKKSSVERYDKSGKLLNREDSDVVTTHTEDIIEHIDDPNLKAISLLLNREGIQSETIGAQEITDTITDTSDFDFVDVEELAKSDN